MASRVGAGRRFRSASAVRLPHFRWAQDSGRSAVTVKALGIGWLAIRLPFTAGRIRSTECGSVLVRSIFWTKNF